MENLKKLDCTKITSIEEIKLILEALDLSISVDSEYFEQLKHLVEEE